MGPGHRLPDVLFLVEAGNEDRHEGGVVQLGRIVHRPLLGALPVEVVVDPPDHPQVGHEEGIVEDEVEQCSSRS
jgi:hypothetical protein